MQLHAPRCPMPCAGVKHAPRCPMPHACGKHASTPASCSPDNWSDLKEGSPLPGSVGHARLPPGPSCPSYSISCTVSGSSSGGGGTHSSLSVTASPHLAADAASCSAAQRGVQWSRGNPAVRGTPCAKCLPGVHTRTCKHLGSLRHLQHAAYAPWVTLQCIRKHFYMPT